MNERSKKLTASAKRDPKTTRALLFISDLRHSDAGDVVGAVRIAIFAIEL